MSTHLGSSIHFADETSRLRQILNEKTALTEEVKERVLSFYEFVQKENQAQNLTRLISPADFFQGHLLDVLELLHMECLVYPALDLGSGVGVPGLLASILMPKSTSYAWILAESEARKAEYLERAVIHLNLVPHVTVFAGRAEAYLKQHTVESIVIRAVGPVSRIYPWLRSCSTWNNLVLFKGPGWEDEWSQFQKTKWRQELKLQKVHLYRAGSGETQRERKIILLQRVPRGTKID